MIYKIYRNNKPHNPSNKKKIKELYAQNMAKRDEELNKIAEETYNEEKLDLIQQLNSINIDINNREQKIDLN